MIMIEAKSLTKRYEDGLLALDAVDLSVKQGEIYCLVGAHGSGKTTILNLFLDFIKPTSGQALINGVDVEKAPLEAKKYVGYTSDDITFYAHLTARQNLDFFVRLGGQEGLTKNDYYRVLREVGLPESAFERKLRFFSKSMRQKLGLAIAILKDPPAILLDEPTSGLDSKSHAELLETLDQLRRREKAILISTHDIFRAREIADRVGILKEGRKILESTHEELRHENLEALYLDYTRGSIKTKGSSDEF